MIEMPSGEVTLELGLVGDARGAKYKTRQITILAAEDWAAALDALTDLAGRPALPWTTRRANLLVSGLRLPRARGAILTVGPVRLAVTGQTFPCSRMEAAHPGLLSALAPEWRGGVTCRVLDGGPIALGTKITIESSPREITRRLPG